MRVYLGAAATSFVLPPISLLAVKLERWYKSCVLALRLLEVITEEMHHVLGAVWTPPTSFTLQLKNWTISIINSTTKIYSQQSTHRLARLKFFIFFLIIVSPLWVWNYGIHPPTQNMIIFWAKKKWFMISVVHNIHSIMWKLTIFSFENSTFLLVPFFHNKFLPHIQVTATINLVFWLFFFMSSSCQVSVSHW